MPFYMTRKEEEDVVIKEEEWHHEKKKDEKKGRSYIVYCGGLKEATKASSVHFA